MCCQDTKFVFQNGSVLILVLSIFKDNFGVIVDSVLEIIFKHPSYEQKKNAERFHSDMKGRLFLFVPTQSILRNSALKLGYAKVNQ